VAAPIVIKQRPAKRQRLLESESESYSDHSDQDFDNYSELSESEDDSSDNEDIFDDDLMMASSHYKPRQRKRPQSYREPPDIVEPDYNRVSVKLPKPKKAQVLYTIVICSNACLSRLKRR
jgi:hypothetical protein